MAARKPATKPKLTPQEAKDRLALTDYILEIWPEEPDWTVITKQLKNFCEEYDLTFPQIRFIIEYGYVYEGIEIDPQYFLGQFIPRFIEPAKKFALEIKENKIFAENMGEDRINFIKPNQSPPRLFKEKLELE